MQILEQLIRKKAILETGAGLEITKKGVLLFQKIGVETKPNNKRIACRACLDWSERKNHLAGEYGASLLTTILQKKWARPVHGSRAVVFSAVGEQAVEDWSSNA